MDLFPNGTCRFLLTEFKPYTAITLDHGEPPLGDQPRRAARPRDAESTRSRRTLFEYGVPVIPSIKGAVPAEMEGHDTSSLRMKSPTVVEVGM